ncbi:MAG TPA: energy transducer TonB [Gemmatimonadaceae bacterium]|nr:energy transducer TonB [Gemmatimonadaceae bacterium]
MLMRQGPLVGGRLLESAALPTRRRWPLVISTVLHAGLISGAVAATLIPKAIRPDDADVPTVQLAVYRPPTIATTLHDAAQPAPRPKGFQELAVPREIPHSIEAATLPATKLEARDFSGRGILGGIADGIAPTPLVGTGSGIGDAIDAAIADQQPYLLPGQIGPAYPEQLRVDAPDGLVVVRFIIDTLGRAEAPSLRVIESSDPLFAQSVRTALERLRYQPARFSGRRIRVRVEERFEFHLAGF